jgi:hypothetical protein
MIAMLGVLSAVLIVVGHHDMSHIGPFPMILGILWAVFTVVALGAKAKPQSD